MYKYYCAVRNHCVSTFYIVKQILPCVYIGIVDYFPGKKITTLDCVSGGNFIPREIIYYTNIHTGQYLYNIRK